MEKVGFHFDEVDHAFEFRLQLRWGTGRLWHWLQFVSHRFNGIEVVGADSVHFVDEGNAGNSIAVGLSPDCF